MKQTIKIPCTGYEVVADMNDRGSDRWLLALHGTPSSNRKKQEHWVSAVAEQAGMSTLAFDFSGHGDSPFRLNDTRPAQHFLEVVCVFDWLRQKHPQAHTSVVGTSYGSYMATQLTKYREFDKLVLRVPAILQPEDFYSRWADIDLDELRHTLRVDEAALAAHPVLARASHFKGKTLVVVHEKDEDIPKETTDAYIRAFDAEAYVAKGFSHSVRPDLLTSEELVAYQRVISDWLQK